MNRLLVTREECDASGRVRITGRRCDHIREILKSEPGDKLRAGYVNGPAASAEVISVGNDFCELEMHEDADAELPQPPDMDILLAMPRPKFFKRILPQLATIGVRHIYLCAADRSERCYFDTHLLEPENYMPLLIEGLEQAMDTRLPDIRIIRPLRNYLRDELAPQYETGHRLLAHPGPVSAPGTVPRGGGPVLVAIGAEGGWSDRELEWFDSFGFTRFSAGLRILRTDMACIAIPAVIDYLRS